MLPEPELKSKLARVALVALDVDGTLTDGGITYAGSELELQRFDVADGQGLVWLREVGIQLVWITGRGCEATRRRANELGIGRLVERSGPKDVILGALQTELGVEPECTLAMGDDLPDLRLFSRSAVTAAPADAHALVRARANIVTEACGGRGAVREVAEILLAARGELNSIHERYDIGASDEAVTRPEAR